MEYLLTDPVPIVKYAGCEIRVTQFGFFRIYRDLRHKELATFASLAEALSYLDQHRKQFAATDKKAGFG